MYLIYQPTELAKFVQVNRFGIFLYSELSSRVCSFMHILYFEKPEVRASEPF